MSDRVSRIANGVVRLAQEVSYLNEHMTPRRSFSVSKNTERIMDSMRKLTTGDAPKRGDDDEAGQHHLAGNATPEEKGGDAVQPEPRPDSLAEEMALVHPAWVTTSLLWGWRGRVRALQAERDGLRKRVAELEAERDELRVEHGFQVSKREEYYEEWMKARKQVSNLEARLERIKTSEPEDEPTIESLEDWAVYRAGNGYHGWASDLRRWKADKERIADLEVRLARAVWVLPDCYYDCGWAGVLDEASRPFPSRSVIVGQLQKLKAAIEAAESARVPVPRELAQWLREWARRFDGQATETPENLRSILACLDPVDAVLVTRKMWEALVERYPWLNSDADHVGKHIRMALGIPEAWVQEESDGEATS